MTLLRGAPREVYRVYDEQSFLEGVEREERPERAPVGTGANGARRLAGAAMVCGAVGAVGGLLAVNGLPSLERAGSRTAEQARVGAGLRLAPTLSRAGIRRARSAAENRRGHASATAQAMSPTPKPEGDEPRRQAAGAHSAPRLPIETTARARAVGFLMSARSVSRPVRRAEFGFER